MRGRQALQAGNESWNHSKAEKQRQINTKRHFPLVVYVVWWQMDEHSFSWEDFYSWIKKKKISQLFDAPFIKKSVLSGTNPLPEIKPRAVIV